MMTKARHTNLTIELLTIVLERYEKEVLDRIPYRVNLIDILGANENAHTEILTEILRYNRRGVYPFLNSFLERHMPESAHLQIVHPNIDTQRDYIDALIWEKEQYAVVIENKVLWAKDQNKQLERYIKAANRLSGCDLRNVYVVYLTADGRKKPDECSLTRKAKAFLEWQPDTPGRYVEINYKDHILTWLKDSVLVDCRYGEPALLSMLQQYIGYLEELFALTESGRKVIVDQFLQKELAQFSQNEQKQYDRITDVLDLCWKCLAQAKWKSNETLNQFSNDVWLFREQMLAENYSLDCRAAFDAKVSVIQEWAGINGFRQPFKYKIKSSGAAIFEFLEAGCRIKFEINMSFDTDEVCVTFHNNDYDKKMIGIRHFAILYQKFKENFPPIKEGEENERLISSFVGKIESKKQLFGFLNDHVNAFLSADSRWRTSIQ